MNTCFPFIIHAALCSQAPSVNRSVKESTCPPQMMDLLWYFYRTTKVRNNHRKFRCWGLDGRTVSCDENGSLQLSERSRRWDLYRRPYQRLPELGLLCSSREEFRWALDCQDGKPVLVHVCLPCWGHESRGMKVLEEINLQWSFHLHHWTTFLKLWIKIIFSNVFFWNFIHPPPIYIYIYHIHASLLNPSIMAESIFIFILRTLQMFTYVTSQMPRLIVLLRCVFVCMFTYTYISQSHTCIHHILYTWIRVIIFQGL